MQYSERVAIEKKLVDSVAFYATEELIAHLQAQNFRGREMRVYAQIDGYQVSIVRPDDFVPGVLVLARVLERHIHDIGKIEKRIVLIPSPNGQQFADEEPMEVMPAAKAMEVMPAAKAMVRIVRALGGCAAYAKKWAEAAGHEDTDYIPTKGMEDIEEFFLEQEV